MCEFGIKYLKYNVLYLHCRATIIQPSNHQLRVQLSFSPRGGNGLATATVLFTQKPKRTHATVFPSQNKQTKPYTGHHSIPLMCVESNQKYTAGYTLKDSVPHHTAPPPLASPDKRAVVTSTKTKKMGQPFPFGKKSRHYASALHRLSRKDFHFRLKKNISTHVPIVNIDIVFEKKHFSPDYPSSTLLPLSLPWVQNCSRISIFHPVVHQAEQNKKKHQKNMNHRPHTPLYLGAFGRKFSLHAT